MEDELDLDHPVTHQFYKEMHDVMTAEAPSRRRYPWFFNYAQNHRDRLKYIAKIGKEDMAGYAKGILERLPKEPTLRDRIKWRLRWVFNVVYDKLPAKIGPFRLP